MMEEAIMETHRIQPLEVVEQKREEQMVIQMDRGSEVMDTQRVILCLTLRMVRMSLLK